MRGNDDHNVNSVNGSLFQDLSSIINQFNLKFMLGAKETNVQSANRQQSNNQTIRFKRIHVYCKKYNDMSAIEIILIGVVILLIFGGKKLPELMKGIGKSVKEFKDAKNEPPVK